MDCNVCLRELVEDPDGTGTCGPCRRGETPESNPDLLDEAEW